RRKRSLRRETRRISASNRCHDCRILCAALGSRGSYNGLAVGQSSEHGRGVRGRTDMPGEEPFRGSRKHILDLVQAQDYLPKLNALLGPHEVEVRVNDQHVPVSPDRPTETTVRTFLKAHTPPGFDLETFSNWWVPDRWKGPTWDLLSTCLIQER